MMSLTIKRFLVFFLALQLAIPGSVFAAAVGEFTSVSGSVTQTRAGEVIAPAVKSPIEMKDLVATEQASAAAMTFSDDSTIQLGQSTKLEISQFLFKKTSRTAVLLLSAGQLKAAVSKFIGGENVFEVHSPTCILGVRGTGFDIVESREADRTKATVSCTEGALNLSALSDKGAVVSTAVLEAGQMAVITGGVITISMIGTAAAAGGGAAAAGSGGAAAAGAGLSTGAIVGLTAAGVAGAGVAVAAAGGGGGGGGGGKSNSPAYDATGTWEHTTTYEENDCGEPVGIGQTDTMVITQTDSTFTVSDDTGSFSGTISGGTYTYTKVFFEDPKTHTETITLVLDSNTGGTWTSDWNWTDGSNSCNGIGKGTLSKIQ
ncbi:MAG: FecR family protein [Thermodesulfobacteriota bacterium]